MTLVGRFRDATDDATITLSGFVNGESQSYIYDNLEFRSRAGGEAFIARLWATRRIGDLLNTIRLHGENKELVDSIVSLSVRYGIITPYTSFLIEEDDILTQSGRERIGEDFAANEARALNSNVTGSVAVDAADDLAQMNAAQAPAPLLSPTATSQGLGGGGLEVNKLKWKPPLMVNSAIVVIEMRECPGAMRSTRSTARPSSILMACGMTPSSTPIRWKPTRWRS